MLHLKRHIHHRFPHLGKADLHIHTNFSDGKPSIEEVLDFVENQTDLRVIAITDHDCVEGALYAKELMKKKKYRFELIIGEEVSSNEGHILGLFIKKKIEPQQPAHEVIRQIHEQGGLAIAAHPLYKTRFNSNKVYAAKGVGSAVLIKEKKTFDAVETVNGVPTYEKVNLEAQYLNRLLLFRAETGGSDAHILESIGKGYTVFEGKTAQDVRKAIEDSQTQALKDDWEITSILRYMHFMWPKGLRLLIRTIILGPKKKDPELISFPSKRKLEKEMQEVE
jgi:predicted metal-dependent phosphoesterase TrpH